jgi:mono/diheme cytochrome c family protein
MLNRNLIARRVVIGAAIVAVVAAAGGAFAWYKGFRVVPQARFAHPAARIHDLMARGLSNSQAEQRFADERFMYGSIGVEIGAGIPYWIWSVLPRVFPEYLPGPNGLMSVGFLWEEGEELPVGFSKMTVGIDRIGITCAICHTSAYRRRGETRPTYVVGGPANTVNFQSYIRFLRAAVSDPRFEGATIQAEIDQVYAMSWVDWALNRFIVIPLTRRLLRQGLEEVEWMNEPGRPDWGPGRVDAFVPIAKDVLDRTGDGKVATADIPPIWHLEARRGMKEPFHWDALNTELRELVFFSAIGAGAKPGQLPVGDLEQLEAYLRRLPPPPFPGTIDAAGAGRGRVIFQARCAQCHAQGGAQTGTVQPLANVGTDANRLSVWTTALANHYNGQGKEYAWGGFSHFQARQGFVALLLDGVWLRAPYLHNGSVPTLDDLLKPAAQRPKVFYRGDDTYDFARMGFVSDRPAENGRPFFRFDTALKGNGNQGHDGPGYGTDLPESERRALLEFLKTL